MGAQRWQDKIITLIGMWLFASPWVLQFVDHVKPAIGTTLWLTVIFGPLISFIGLSSLVTIRILGDWFIMGVAAFLAGSSLYFEFLGDGFLDLNILACAAVAFLAATWAILAAHRKESGQGRLIVR